MAKRRKMSYSGSRKYFTATAGVHPKNNQPRPSRGGNRM